MEVAYNRQACEQLSKQMLPKNQYTSKISQTQKNRTFCCSTSINHLVGCPKVQAQKNNLPTATLLNGISLVVALFVFISFECLCVHHKLMNLYDVKLVFAIIVILWSSSRRHPHPPFLQFQQMCTTSITNQQQQQIQCNKKFYICLLKLFCEQII